MANIFEWLVDNCEWVFGGIGVLVLTTVYSFFSKIWKTALTWLKFARLSLMHQSNQNVSEHEKIVRAKETTKILFIDDDTTFKVVQILKREGWKFTTIISDVSSLADSSLVEAHIVFVDINGVGKELGFKDDGLGLTLAIKQTYPNKHVIVYSAERRGNRFHEGLKAADDLLPKNAQPYEFQKIIEDFVNVGK